jgi:transcriptional regulator with XRE-family HTH domain
MFGRGRSSHYVLAQRADELGIDSRELAARANVDQRRAADGLENDIDLEAVLTVGEVKRMLQALDLDFLTVFRIPCAFCKRGDQQFAELRPLPRNALVARRREQLGLSQEDLLVKLKITEWFQENSGRPWAQKRMALWRAIEEGPDSLDDLSLDQVRLLNRVLLLPVQLLLGVRCGTCGDASDAS